MGDLTIKPANDGHLLLQNDAGTTAIEIKNDENAVYISGDLVPSTPLSHRNMIINGAMNVAQRGASSIVQTYGTLDRWENYRTGFAGEVTFSQDPDAPAGFNNSMKMTNASDEASLSAGDLGRFTQKIEAQDCQQLAYGTDYAKISTLSFWVRSTVIGTGCVYILIEDDSDKQWSGSYPISNSDTWEYKTLTIPANTASTINDDNGIGLSINWVLMAGATYTGGSSLSSSWEASTNNKLAYGQTNLLGGASGREVQITGVQLELGSSATPFEHRSYGEELARCQRYFVDVINKDQQYDFGGWGGNKGTTVIRFMVPLNVPLRATPSVVSAGTLYSWTADGEEQFSSPTVVGSQAIGGPALLMEKTGVTVTTSGSSGQVAGETAGAYLWLDAEL